MDTASLAIELPDQSLPDAGPEAALPAELRLMDAYWRAANYLSAGQIYLYDRWWWGIGTPRRVRTSSTST